MSDSANIETLGFIITLAALAAGLIVLRYRIRALEAAASDNKKKLDRWENEFTLGINDVQQQMINGHRKLTDQIDSIKSKLFK